MIDTLLHRPLKLLQLGNLVVVADHEFDVRLVVLQGIILQQLVSEFFLFVMQLVMRHVASESANVSSRHVQWALFVSRLGCSQFTVVPGGQFLQGGIELGRISGLLLIAQIRNGDRYRAALGLRLCLSRR